MGAAVQSTRGLKRGEYRPLERVGTCFEGMHSRPPPTDAAMMASSAGEYARDDNSNKRHYTLLAHSQTESFSPMRRMTVCARPTLSCGALQ